MLDKINAREKLISAVLRRLAAERAHEHTHFDADLELANDMIDEAASELHAINESQPHFNVPRRVGDASADPRT